MKNQCRSFVAVGLSGFTKLLFAAIVWTSLPYGLSYCEIGSANEPTVKKVPATLKLISQVKNAANRSKTPQAALKLYKSFIDSHQLTEDQEEKLKPEIQKWLERRDNNLIRNGKNWVTVDEHKMLSEEADLLVKQAIELIKINNSDAATELLEQASKTDRNGLRADFILGLLNSPLINNDPKTATEHFQKVVKRTPDNIAALNNLAISQIRSNDHTDAIETWRKALDFSPKSSEITHNLGYFISEANSKCIQTKSSTLKKASKLYAVAITTSKAGSMQKGVGWIYMPLILPEEEQLKPLPQNNDPPGALIAQKETRQGVDQSKTEKEPVPQEFTLTGSATGFVIHDNFILTNHHVVHHPDYGLAGKITASNQGRHTEAKVVATNNDLDIAILKIDDLKLPSIQICSAEPRLASEIVVLGYPQTDQLGQSLKSTRGSISGFAGRTGGRFLVYDAVTNPGNSGGPICNQFGQAVAIHAEGWGVLKLGSLNSGKLGAGIPLTESIKFLNQHIPDLKTFPKPENGPQDWPDVVELAANSTVLLEIHRAVMHMEVPNHAPQNLTTQKNIQQKIRNTQKETLPKWIDYSCNHCNGTGLTLCSQPQCKLGRIPYIQTKKRLIVSRLGTQVATDYQSATKVCPTCNGTDRLRCPFCN